MQGLLLITHYVLSLYAMLVLLRFLAQWLGVDFRNPISRFIIQASDPALRPLRRIAPTWKGKDMAALLLAAGIIGAESLLLAALLGVENRWALLAVVPFRCVILILKLYFYLLLGGAIISWINPNPYHPAQLFITPLTAPLLQPLRKRIPPLGGSIDITPMLLILAIYFLQIQLPIWFLSLVQTNALADPGLSTLIALMGH